MRRPLPSASVGSCVELVLDSASDVAYRGRHIKGDGEQLIPREFLNEIVQPNVEEFYINIGSKRHAFNAIAAVDSLAAHIYIWCKGNAPKVIADIRHDSAYRERLAEQSPDFRLLRDIAKAQKHVYLEYGKPKVTTAAQVTTRFGWDEATWDQDEWDKQPHVVVTTDDGHQRYVTQIVAASLAMLETEMVSLGVLAAAGAEPVRPPR
jgi:hypothetical protein